MAELGAAGAVRGDGTVLIDSGVIYFSPPAVAALVDVARRSPLDASTYLGLDAGLPPPALRIELYSDIMLAMGGGLGASKEEYQGTPTADIGPMPRMRAARDLLWDALSDTTPFFATVVEGGGFSHVGTTPEYLTLLTSPSAFGHAYKLSSAAAYAEQGRPVLSAEGGCSSAFPHAAVQNSLLWTTSVAGALACSSSGSSDGAIMPASAGEQSVGPHPVYCTRGPGSVVEHSELFGSRWAVGAGALVSALRSVPDLVVRDGIGLQELELAPGSVTSSSTHSGASVGSGRVISVLGVHDGIKDPYTKKGATVCGAPWAALFKTAGVTAADIWPAPLDPVNGASACTLWTAKLFPVMTDVPRRGTGNRTDPLSPSSAAWHAAHDLPALWLQWLAEPLPSHGSSGGLPPLASGAHSSGSHSRGASHGNDSSSSSSSSGGGGCGGLPAATAAAARASHLSPSVIAAWRASTRFSLKDILAHADATREFAWRRDLRGRIDVWLLQAAISSRGGGADAPLAGLITRLGKGASAAHAKAALRALDDVASSPSSGLDVASRAFATQSALLWAMAGWGGAGGYTLPTALPASVTTSSSGSNTAAGGGGSGGGIVSYRIGVDINDFHSGPAHNTAWADALALLEKSESVHTSGSSGSSSCSSSGGASPSPRATAVALLASLREGWGSRVHTLGRAARHYERAAQLLTKACVRTAPVGAPTPLLPTTSAAAAAAAPGSTSTCTPLLGKWVTATAPARVDLAGGWSDTPPISYEARGPPPTPTSTSGPARLSPLGAAAAMGGGLVVNVAVTVDGARPLGARARLVAAAAASTEGGGCIVIRTRGPSQQSLQLSPRLRASSSNSALAAVVFDSATRAAAEENDRSTSASAAAAAAAGAAARETTPAVPADVVSVITLRTLGDCCDYDQPRAEGSLVKCALLVLDVVPPSALTATMSTLTATATTAAAGVAPGPCTDLPSCLRRAGVPPGYTLEIETWSLLPHGSGLGTSSILAGTVCAAIAGALGRSYDSTSLLHLVLALEQMLSTGGGWQDQVGG